MLLFVDAHIIIQFYFCSKNCSLGLIQMKKIKFLPDVLFQEENRMKMVCGFFPLLL